ncbi:MAG: AMP-binding protein [Pseudomonadota bacterium]
MTGRLSGAGCDTDDDVGHRFWMDAAAALEWDRAPEILSRPLPSGLNAWFPDGLMNICHNAVDRHVAAGRGGDLALVYDSAMTEQVAKYTFAQLQTAVAQTAGMLHALGVGKGDRVIIYMPMIPQAVFAMLACARIGAVHSVVFGGFAPRELATRIDDAQPWIVLTASGGIEPSRLVPYLPLVAEAIALAAHKPAHILSYQRAEMPADRVALPVTDWEEALGMAEPIDCTPCASTDPLYILYTSGTTGKPKGVVRDHGGHATALLWAMRNIMGARPGSVYWAASDIGWVVGHSFIVYGPLLAGCATILYEGKPVGTPDAGAFWRVAREHGVEILFTAPTAIRAIKRDDPDGSLVGKGDTLPLKRLFLAGERADQPTIDWAREKLGVPVLDNWWQTELGWPALSPLAGRDDLEVREGCAGRPVPGYRFAILGPDGAPVPPGAVGDIAIRLPLPPGTLTGLWNNEAGLTQSYLERFPGYYVTGDSGQIDEDGFLSIHGRIDDIINVAGHRLSTGSMEAAVLAHGAVAECAVVGVADALKGQLPWAFVVLEKAASPEPGMVEREIVRLVRDMIGPVAALRDVITVPALPKTRSGKILRRLLREIAERGRADIPATVESPHVIEQIMQRVKGLQRPASSSASDVSDRSS